MNALLKNALCVAGLVIATQAAAQVTFYEGEDFRGRSFTADRQVGNFERYGFNDRASSAVVRRDRDDAVARALLDAVNRRISRLETDRPMP